MTNPATLNLEASKRIREVLGDEFETERAWVEMTHDGQWDNLPWDTAKILSRRLKFAKSPNFQELIRLLPAIAKAKGLENDQIRMRIAPDVPLDFNQLWVYALSEIYMHAPTPEEAMERISKRLMEIL